MLAQTCIASLKQDSLSQYWGQGDGPISRWSPELPLCGASSSSEPWHRMQFYKVWNSTHFRHFGIDKTSRMGSATSSASEQTSSCFSLTFLWVNHGGVKVCERKWENVRDKRNVDEGMTGETKHAGKSWSDERVEIGWTVKTGFKKPIGITIEEEKKTHRLYYFNPKKKNTIKLLKL